MRHERCDPCPPLPLDGPASAEAGPPFVFGLPARSKQRLPRGRIALLLACAAGFGPRAQPAQASDPVGVYSLVEDVSLEADPAAPEQMQRIRIYGHHALAYRPKEGDQRGWGIYTAPAAGYLYFRCPAAELATCALEWQDLAAAIGDERCAAYGQRYLTDPEPNGRLRDPAAAVEAPDPYPIGQGVLMVREGERGSCAELRAARDRSAGAPTPGAGAPPTASASATAGSEPPSPEPKPSEAATQGPPDLKPTAAKPDRAAKGALLLPSLVGITHVPLASDGTRAGKRGPTGESGSVTGEGMAPSAARSAAPVADAAEIPERGRGLLSGSALLVLGAALWMGLRRPSLA